MLTFAVNTSFIILGLAFLLGFIRLVRGPSIPDRVVSLELIASLTVGFIAVQSIASGSTAFLDVAMVLALTGFLATVGFARLLEEGGERDDK